MLLRAVFYLDKKDVESFSVTLKNFDYEDLKNHFVGFSTLLKKPVRVKLFEIEDDETATHLVAEHII